MENKKVTFKSIDEYIATFPEGTQKILQELRAAIKTAAPEAQETISYQMPTFTLKGHYLVYFGAYKKHIGFYPVPVGKTDFDEQMSVYQTGKGTLQFPLDRPIPFDLVSKIVKFRAQETSEKSETKGKKK